MKKQKSFNQIKDINNKIIDHHIEISGLYGSALAKFLIEFEQNRNESIIVLTAEPEDAEDIISDIKVFGKESYLFPPWDILPNETEVPDLDIAQDRIIALRKIINNNSNIVIISVSALLQPVLSPNMLYKGSLTVKAGMEISPQALIARLLDAGFSLEDDVEIHGQCSRRGGIIDVFPFFSDRPIRLDFFGDEIDTIRYYDAGTQRK